MKYNIKQTLIMTSNTRTLVLFLISTVSYITALNKPLTPLGHMEYTQVFPQYMDLPLQLVNPQESQPKCYNKMNNKWSICQTAKPINAMNVLPIKRFVFGVHLRPRNPVYNQFIGADGFNAMTTGLPSIQSGLTRSFIPQMTNPLNLLPININKSIRTTQHSKDVSNENIIALDNLNSAYDNTYAYSSDSRSNQFPLTRIATPKEYTTILDRNTTLINNVYSDFIRGLDELERKFYSITFNKLTDISPMNRKENGISFVQSGLFLIFSLIALSSEVDIYTRQEIEKCININFTQSVHAKLSAVTESILSSFPSSSNDLKFRWSTRLILWPNHTVSDEFKTGPAAALRMHIDILNGTETPEKIAEILNDMVEIDSGGSIRNTFEEDDLTEGGKAKILTTLYLRGRWRSAPTLLNGSRSFRDTEYSPTRSIRCIRINDVMRYADLTEWDAEAIEIFYATPGLSLMMLVPRGNSLRRLADHVATTSMHYITQRMHSIRIAVTMPLYTLRMTLLLPNKLEAMGLSRLVDTNNTTKSITLSHAVQRLMFWAEAGRNAFKDDGIEWDATPELELVVDRPYIFFVRWQNLTLMNGNFVL